MSEYMSNSPHPLGSGSRKDSTRYESFRAGYPADVPGQKLRAGRLGSKAAGRPSKSWKNRHLDMDVHDPNARTSMTPGACKKTSGKTNFGLIFRHPVGVNVSNVVEDFPLETSVSTQTFTKELIF